MALPTTMSRSARVWVVVVGVAAVTALVLVVTGRWPWALLLGVALVLVRTGGISGASASGARAGERWAQRRRQRRRKDR
jgi:fatty acid desaturase